MMAKPCAKHDVKTIEPAGNGYHPAIRLISGKACSPECGTKIALERRSKEREKAEKAFPWFREETTTFASSQNDIDLTGSIVETLIMAFSYRGIRKTQQAVILSFSHKRPDLCWLHHGPRLLIFVP